MYNNIDYGIRLFRDENQSMTGPRLWAFGVAPYDGACYGTGCGHPQRVGQQQAYCAVGGVAVAATLGGNDDVRVVVDDAYFFQQPGQDPA